MMFRKQTLAILCLAVVVVLTSCLAVTGSMRVRTFIQDGRSIDEIVVDGRPPDNYRAPTVAVPQTDAASGVATLTSVPAFDWCYGCSATSAAMMMGYYDNTGYPNMYAGPTNGGVCPMDNGVWGYGESPLSATHQGLDGRNPRGHVDDYWRATNNCDSDPYVGAWTEHTQGECTGDYMGTNQSKYSNCDGATTFYFYTDGSPLSDYTGGEPSVRDGCHGLKLFVQSRGYSVTANYSQYIMGYNGNTSGFTFSDFQTEVNAGRPVLIQVTNHTMLGYGYDNSTQTIYVHDTWDHNNHSMTWGGSYSGLSMYGVTVLRMGCSGASPVITGQPVGGGYCVGSSATFAVTATGAMQYQWRKNGVNISGAVGSSYMIGSVAAGDAGNYDCVVTNACGSTTSNTAVLTINTPPSVTANPTDQMTFTGNTATFAVAASGTSLAYQWQVSVDGGASYSNVTGGTGANTASYTTAPTVITDDGKNYKCVVSGACSPNAVSAAATLSVDIGVVLLSEGFESAFVNGAPPGWTKEFSVASVDWARTIGDHSGGTAEEGTYDAMLYSSSTQNHKTYLVTPAIGFEGCGSLATLDFWHKQAASGTKQDSLEVYYKTSAGGAWTLLASYTASVTDWTRRTIVLPNVTSTYYIGFLGNAKAGNGVCIDNVVVTQGCCPPAITMQPSPVDACVGGSASFSVAADGVGVTYQWRKNGSNISGATDAMLTIDPVGVGNAGIYDCVVGNGCASAVSDPAALTVGTGPSITGQPVGATTWVGGSVTLAVTANGTGTVHFQWRENSANIVGANGSSYAISSAAVSDSGSYDCVVTDDCGSATSAAAAVTVIAPTATIAGVKLIPDGQTVALVGKPITLARTDYFYIEEPNRSAGIRIERSSHGLSAGSCAKLVGVLSTNGDGERLITASAAIADGVGSAPAIAMGNKSLCGTDWQYDAMAHTGQIGGYGMAGLNNVGLLVKTWGVYTKTGDNLFILDDGSGNPITCLVEPGVFLSTTWQYASATGISSIYEISDGLYFPRLLVSDVHGY